MLHTALMQALKISEKAVAQGFEWTAESDIWEQLESELDEFREAAKNAEGLKGADADPLRKEMDLEMGDILFTMVNIARWHKLNPEESLLMALEKFRQRFYQMEQSAERPLKELTVGEWDVLWKEAKATKG